MARIGPAARLTVHSVYGGGVDRFLGDRNLGDDLDDDAALRRWAPSRYTPSNWLAGRIPGAGRRGDPDEDKENDLESLPCWNRLRPSDVVRIWIQHGLTGRYRCSVVHHRRSWRLALALASSRAAVASRVRQAT